MGTGFEISDGLNLAFALATSIICLTSVFFTFAQKRTDKLRNKVFVGMLMVLTLNGFSELSNTCINVYGAKDGIDGGAYKAFTFLYFAFHSMLAPLFYLYVLGVCGKLSFADRRSGWMFDRSRSGRLKENPVDFGKPEHIIYAAVFAVTELAVLTNPLTGFVYTFGEHGEFMRSKGEIIIYLAAGMFLVTAVYMLIYTWSALTEKRRYMIVDLFVLVSVGILIQLFTVHVKIELFIEALAMLGVMVSIESEDDRIDSDTGIYDRKALNSDLMTYLKGGRSVDIMALRITNSEEIERTCSTEDDLPILVFDFLKTKLPRSYIYSTGPYTYVIALPDIAETDALWLMDEITARFREPWELNDTPLMIKAVILHAKMPEKFSTVEQAFIMIDSPVPSGNTKTVLTGSDLDYILRRKEVEKAIIRGLEQHTLEVFYQPTYSLEGLRLHGAEALIRLHDTEMGELYPGEFIPIAEQCGLIDDVDDFVLREVCAFIKSGIPAEHGISCINVNLSVVQFMQPGFVAHISGIVEEFGVDKSSINLEITESVAATDYKLLQTTVCELREQGFSFSMDDFGTGYSNLQSIFSLDFDVIKIDKSMLWSADNAGSGRIILENSVNMIKQMRREILVEGVETAEQIELLSTLDVDYMQGFYFSRPVPKDAFIRIITDEDTPGKGD